MADRLAQGLAALAAAGHGEAWKELRTSPEAELKAALRDGVEAIARLARVDPSWRAKHAAARPHLEALRRLLDAPGLDEAVHASAAEAVKALGLLGP
jgi:Spy/CpxP family protein refolding chaperone